MSSTEARPSSFSRCEWLQRVGSGARSRVYRARLDGQDVIVKVHEDPRDSEEAARLYRREAAIHAGLRHAAVPRVYEVGVHEDKPYIISEYVSGRTLAEHLSQGPLEVATAVRIAAAVADALTEVHRTGLVHRDIKPANILIDATGAVRLIDFGLARHSIEGQPEATAGTLRYSAPEQIGLIERPVDGRADLYALGTVLFEAIHGEAPFATDDIPTLLHRHAAVRPPRLDQVEPGADPVLASIVDRLLEKDPDERYPSASALRSDLEHLGQLREQNSGGREVVLGADHATRATGSFVGRDAELDQLRRVAEAAWSGAARAVLVTGPAGSGKTRLVEEGVGRFVDPRLPLLRGRCRQGDPYPLAAVREAVVTWLLQRRRAGSLAWEATRAALRAAAGDLAPLVARLEPGVAAALEVERPSVGLKDGREVLHNALARFLGAFARASGGLTLWIDDVQWIDSEGREALRVLANEATSAPLLVLLTGRDDADSRGPVAEVLRSLAPMTPRELHLGALPDVDVRALVAAAVGSELPALITDQIVRRAESHPLLVLQLVHALKDSGALVPDWGSWRIDGEAMASLSLPAGATELLSERVATLPGEGRAVLEAAALLGARFPLGLLIEAVGHGRAREVTAAIGEALSAQIVEWTDAESLGFVHDRVRESLLAAPAVDPVAIHRRAAAWYDRIPLPRGREIYERARHHQLGWATERPMETAMVCIDAARAAVDEHAWNQAWDLLSVVRRLDVVGAMPVPARLAWYRLSGLCAFQTQRVEEAGSAFDAALKLAKDPADRAELHGLIARATIFAFDTREGTRRLELAFAELGAPLPTATAAGPAEAQAGLMQRMQAALGRAMAGEGFGAERDSRSARIKAQLADTCFLIGYYDRNLLMALQGGVLALEAAWSLGETAEAVSGFATFAMLMGLSGKRELVRRFGDLAVKTARKLGDRQAQAIAQSTVAIALHFCGDVDEALETQREVFEKLAPWLGPLNFQNCVIDLSWNLYVRGMAEEALRVSTTAMRRLDATGGAFMGAYACRAASAAMYAAARLGRAGLAAEMQERVRRYREVVPADRTIPWVTVEGFLVGLAVCQGNFGPEWEAAASRHDAWGIPPERAALHAKHFYVEQAHALVELVLRAAPEEREARLAAADAGVARLEAVANLPTLRAHALVLRAAVHQLREENDRVAPLLAEAENLAWTAYNPWALAEAARVRGRLLRGTPAGAAAATRARAICREEGWSPLRRRIEAEFSIASDASSVTRGGDTWSDSVTSNEDTRLRHQLDGILALSRATAAVLDPRLQARIALDEIIRQLGAERAYLFTVEGEPGLLRFEAGRDAEGRDLGAPIGFSHSTVETVLAKGRPVLLNSRDEALQIGAESVLAYELRSVLAAPLLAGERMLGVLYLDNRLAHGVFTEDHVELLHALGRFIAVALQTARTAQLELRLKAETEQRRFAETMQRMVSSVTSTLNLREGLQNLLDVLGEEIPSDAAMVVVREGSTTEPGAWRGLEETEVQALLADAALTGALVAPERPKVADMVGGRQAAILALRSRDVVIGDAILVRNGQISFREAEVGFGAAMVGQASIAIDNARLFRHIRTLADHDDLTQLLNRRAFYRRASFVFEECAADGQPVCAVMFDVDHFKSFNDRHGHAVGDEVLKLVSRTSAGTVRSNDLLGRHGGEEFAVLLPGAAQVAAMEIGRRLRQAVEGARLPDPALAAIAVTISVGVAERVSGDTVASLINRADAALYAAKAQGRNRVCFAGAPEQEGKDGEAQRP